MKKFSLIFSTEYNHEQFRQILFNNLYVSADWKESAHNSAY